MRDYIRRLLIAGVMALCVSLLFFGVKRTLANTININELTSNWMWPSDGVITDTYGTRGGQHKGIDIAAPMGSAIYSVDNGIVSKSYYSDTYGNVVFIKHDNQIETVYAHLEERIVQEGTTVQKGDKIGRMGNTGDSSGVHLHFEVHLSEWTFDKANAINPTIAIGEAEGGQAVAAVLEDDSTEQVLETAARIEVEADVSDDQIQLENNKDIQQHDSKGSAEVQKNHTVQKGETLWSIAQAHQTTVRLIQIQNGLKTNQIRIGQALEIPINKVQIYVVQPGDTLTSIAKKSNISVGELLEINHLTAELIKPQQELYISK
jgi:LysM repeat protein